MTNQPQNDQFHDTSFLEGQNSAYLEAMYARYAEDPDAVDSAWKAFFQSMDDDNADVKAQAAGPSWARSDWPPMP